MKIPAKFVASVFLLSIIREAVPSNPDSEVVQDPEEYSEVPVRKSEQIRSVRSLPISAVLINNGSSYTIFLEPVHTFTAKFWRQVASIGEIPSGDSSQSLAVFYDWFSRGMRVLKPVSTLTGTLWKQIASTERIRNHDGYIDIIRSYNNYQTRPLNREIFTSKPATPGSQTKANPVNGIGGETNLGPRPNSATTLLRRYTAPPNQANPENIPPKAQPGTRNISPNSNLFAGIVNNFAFKLVENLNPNSNFVISPLSIYIALSMCYLGSDGETKAQLERVLGMNECEVHGVHLHEGITDLVSTISPDSGEYQLFMTNGLFLGEKFRLEEPYKNDVQKFYAAELKNLDFKNSPVSIRSINEWVAKATRNMITNFLETPLPPSTALAILNAIYFKGIWKTKFPVESTYNKQFFSSDGSEKETPFMNLYQEMFPVLHSDKHRHSFIKLPYQGDQVSMIIALPYSEQESPMPNLTGLALCHIQDAMITTKLNTLSVPKFHLGYMKSLKKPLMEMGLSDIFGRSVNMTKMRRQNDLYVTDVLQKAVVDVNEEGATASAASGVHFVPLSSNSEEFVANHPFAFYIVHEASGLVLFYGKIFDLGETSEIPSGDQEKRYQDPTNNNRQDTRDVPGDLEEITHAPTGNRRDDTRVVPGYKQNVYPVPTNNRRQGPRVATSNQGFLDSTSNRRENTHDESSGQRELFYLRNSKRREGAQLVPDNQEDRFRASTSNRRESTRLQYNDRYLSGYNLPHMG